MAQQLLAAPNETAFDWRFHLFGVPVRIHPLFWLMGGLVVYGAAGDDLVRILIGIVCVFISILVHEFGHALSGRHYGDHGNRVVLYMMGGLCIHGHGSIPPRWPRIWQIFWGPLAGMILGAISFGVYYAILQKWIPFNAEDLIFALSVMIWINVVWSIMNLLPVFPLDGGQIVREWLLWKRPRGGEVLAFTISAVAGVLVPVAGVVYCVMTGHPVPIFAIAMFLYFAFQSWQMRQQVLQYGSLGGEVEEPRAAWEQDPDWWKKR